MKKVKKLERKCITCSSIFYIYPSARNASKFCSKKCYIRTGENNPKWRGGKRLVGGYYYIYSPEHPNATKAGYVCEHRVIIEDNLGRILNEQEAVHHINGNKIDNRIDNLIVLSHSKHTRVHKTGVKQSPEHIKNRFATRKKADMSKFIRDKNGRFISH